MINDKQINKVSNTQISIEFSENDLVFETFSGYDTVNLNEGGITNEIGKPQLPVKSIYVALPDGTRATSVRVLATTEQILPGSYDIYPAQEPQKIGESNNNFIKDYDFYQTNSYYPSRVVKLTGMTDLAGQAMAMVTIYPLEYNPASNTLKLITTINFEIVGEPGYICGDYLPNHLTVAKQNNYLQEVKSMVINPKDVALKTNPAPLPLGVPAGDYDYVIVTQTSWVSAFQPLADWKTKKGVPATTITTDWIYNQGGYSGTNVQKIKAFVQDVYNTWGTTYVLLGGDTDIVPCHTRTFPGVDYDPVPNDVYFADFDADWIAEVNIGRASVSGTGNSTGEIGNFIYKVLTYEKNPPLTSYATNAGFFGFDLDYSTHAQQCKVNIDNSYIPASWSVTTVYDSQSGNHLTNVINALNSGQNLANHADHSGSDVMGVGYVNHDWLIDNSDMDALTNGNKQTILYSMGCDPAAYDVDDCIAEHFVQNSNGGGIAFIGNSRYGWYNPGYYNTLSMEFDVRFFESIFSENNYKLGAAFSDHKNDVMGSHAGDDYYQYCYTELTLLGDPELPIWLNNPSTLVVSHPSSIPLGSSSFTVHVQTTTGSPIQNAYVCLWKTTEVYLTGLTDSNGDVTLTPAPSSGGSMSVTVTKQDYIPYEGTATVTTENHPPATPSNPSPANGAFDIDVNANLGWACSDPDGDTLTYDVYFGASTNPPLVSSGQSATSYDPGTMDYNTAYHWKIVATDVHDASTSGPVWGFTTKDEPLNYPPEFSSETPTNGAIGVPLTTSSISVYIQDHEGDSFYYSIETSPFIGSTSGNNQNNGTKTCSVSALAFSTTYTWFVNATDAGSGQTTSQVYTFTTESVANDPPNAPGIDGPTSGKTGTLYTYTFTSTDPENDDVSYFIDWGDGTTTDWTTYQSSGTPYSEDHAWNITGAYVIKAKAKDTSDAESSWSILSVTMPRNKIVNNLFLSKILNNHPYLYKLLQTLYLRVGLFLA